MANTQRKQFNVRPDTKGRITLGNLAKGVSSYEAEERTDGSILLVPKVEIPAREAWLFKNPKAIASVRRGLAQAAEGKGRHMSFAKYADEDIDE